MLLGLVSGGNWFDLSIGPCLGKLWCLEAFCLDCLLAQQKDIWTGQDTCLYCGETSKVDTAIPVRGQLKIGQKIPVAEVGAFTRAGLHPTCQANMCFHRVYVPVLHAASSPHTLLLICGLPDVIKQSDFSTAAHQWDIARHSFGFTALFQRGKRLSVCSAWEQCAVHKCFGGLQTS